MNAKLYNEDAHKYNSYPFYIFYFDVYFLWLKYYECFSLNMTLYRILLLIVFNTP